MWEGGRRGGGEGGRGRRGKGGWKIGGIRKEERKGRTRGKVTGRGKGEKVIGRVGKGDKDRKE